MIFFKKHLFRPRHHCIDSCLASLTWSAKLIHRILEWNEQISSINNNLIIRFSWTMFPPNFYQHICITLVISTQLPPLFLLNIAAIIMNLWISTMVLSSLGLYISRRCYHLYANLDLLCLIELNFYHYKMYFFIFSNVFFHNTYI